MKKGFVYDINLVRDYNYNKSVIDDVYSIIDVYYNIKQHDINEYFTKFDVRMKTEIDNNKQEYVKYLLVQYSLKEIPPSHICDTLFNSELLNHLHRFRYDKRQFEAIREVSIVPTIKYFITRMSGRRKVFKLI